MASRGSEARRRRILDRGSDRLALITGRIQTLGTSTHSHTASCPPLLSQDHDLQSHFADQSPVSTPGGDKMFGSLLQRQDSGTELGKFNVSNSGQGGQPLLQKCETNVDSLKASTWEASDRIQSPLIASVANDREQSPVIPSAVDDRQKSPVIPPAADDRVKSPVIPSGADDRVKSSAIPSAADDRGKSSAIPSAADDRVKSSAIPSAANDRVQSPVIPSAAQCLSISASGRRHFQSIANHCKMFTPSQIISAIQTTESVRIYCSLALAILVLLCYVGFPVLGASIIMWRPLYLLLLTNISVVVALLILEEQKGLHKGEQEANNVPPAEGYDLADQVGKALESGLLLQSIASAVFMDCSVYAIVVVSGLSLAQKLGW